jgi:hypothetical protein
MAARFTFLRITFDNQENHTGEIVLKRIDYVYIALSKHNAAIAAWLSALPSSPDQRYATLATPDFTN